MKKQIEKEIHTTVCPCVFKRTQKSKSERGIAIGEVEVIIDSKFRYVKEPVWSYDLLWSEGTLPITL